MVSIVFYFHAHQPIRIRRYTFFDIGENHNYFNDPLNKRILDRVVRKCYIPAGKLMLELIEKYDFKVSYSFSGTLLEQLERWHPEVLDLYNRLVDTGNVEIVDEPYYHSLVFLFDKDEFVEQIKMHREKIEEIFGYRPTAFRNMELVYSNEIAKIADKLGYKVILAEGHEKVLGWRSPTYVYKAKDCEIRVMMRHYRLSDDIAFRFSCWYWDQYPLTADKFASWVSAINGNGYVVNLFMDYETLGEHQWPETGIFEFFRHLPKYLLQHPDNEFCTVTEAAMKYEPVDEIDVPFYLSWADEERDLTAWIGDKIQQEALRVFVKVWNKFKELIRRVGFICDELKKIYEDLRRLTTSDNLYYMSLKFNADGTIHKYFREESFSSPYDAFISYLNILRDIELRLEEVESKLLRDQLA